MQLLKAAAKILQPCRRGTLNEILLFLAGDLQIDGQ
jgi:hypothetical protein